MRVHQIDGHEAVAFLVADAAQRFDHGPQHPAHVRVVVQDQDVRPAIERPRMGHLVQVFGQPAGRARGRKSSQPLHDGSRGIGPRIGVAVEHAGDQVVQFLRGRRLELAQTARRLLLQSAQRSATLSSRGYGVWPEISQNKVAPRP